MRKVAKLPKGFNDDYRLAEHVFDSGIVCQSFNITVFLLLYNNSRAIEGFNDALRSDISHNSLCRSKKISDARKGKTSKTK